MYEIWIENRNYQRITEESTNYESNTNVRIEIEVDGKELALSSSFLAHSENRKYVKVGEVEIGEGEHKIEAHSSLFIAHGKDEKIKLILVSKKEREKVEKEIWKRINQLGAELYYILYL